MRNAISITTVLGMLVWLTFLVLTPVIIASNGPPYIILSFKTDGDFYGSIFNVDHRIGSGVETDYHIEFSTSGDNPYVGIDIEWTGNKTKVTFGPAKATIFSSRFSMQNGSVKRFSFWDDPYYSNFSPELSEKGSGYSCSYSINLTNSIKEAKIKFANRKGLIAANQSDLGGRIFFETSDVDTIEEQGRERRLQFSFNNDKANLLLFRLSVTIPDESDFVGVEEPTLDGVKMNKILKRVEGIVPVVPYEFGSHTAIVEWRVPKALAYWEIPPVSWILSAVVGGVIVSIPISIVSAYLWNWMRKPKLSINLVPRHDGKEPAIHPKTGMAFYHLVIENHGKTTAYDSEIYISFKDMDGNKLFSLKGKWDRTPEPMGPIQKGGWSRLWPALIPLTELVNVRPSISETFCLVVKDNEDPCYAFNAYSYLYSFKNPGWQLPLGKFIVEIEVRCGNVKKQSKFLIENKGKNVQDVTISKLDSREKQ